MTLFSMLYGLTISKVYLNRLQWRIQKLERDLAVPRREQHDFSYMILKKPQENVIYGNFS